jgi:glucosamine--fructose-6-phosphate aminotransferase (isomerizing)
MFEAYTDIPVEVDFGSEYKYRRHILHKNNTAVFVSQSGETSDVIASLKDVKSSGVLTLGMVNNVGTTIARKVDAGVYLHAGLEVGVAATKTFTSQLVALLLLALFLNNKPLDESVIRELNDIPKLAKRVLNTDGQMKTLADKYKNYNSMYYIGRRYSYPIALEGALKAKEVAYIHAEGLCAGELKHGDLSLVGEGLPTVAIVPRDSVYEKTLSNIEEIKTRHGTVIAVATEGDERVAGLVDDVIYIPSVREEITPILSVIPLQLFAYYLGIARNCDVDKPRNLAKSVTVE